MKKTFERIEQKYLIDNQLVKELIEKHSNELIEDLYFDSFIQNIYFDTPNKDVILTALEKVKYKEKLRLRAYNEISQDSSVFVEIKKKHNGVVFKRRTEIPIDQLELENTSTNQVLKEVQWMKERDLLQPSLYIAYQRKAYVGVNDHSFRVTFDNHIVYRTEDLTLGNNYVGTDITPTNQMVMETKTAHGFPLWFVEFLSEHQLYPTQYSKFKASCIDLLKKEGQPNVY